MSENEKQNSSPVSSEIFTPSAETERQIAQKFVSRTTQVFIQLMPLGGSGGAFISFLLKQEWVMALITFPVIIVTVVWAKYTEGFLAQLAEICQLRGKEDANSLMTFLQNLDEAMRWQLAGTKNKYLRCQGNDTLHSTNEGVVKTFKPLLKDVFVPLALSGDFFRGMEGQALPLPHGYKWEQEIIEHLQKDEGLSIWHLFRRGKNNQAYRNLAILAWGGYGKTTLLRHITYIYTQKKRNHKNAPDLIPVLLYLRQWQNQIRSTPQTDLPNLIEQYHIPNLPEGKSLNLPPNWVKNQLKAGKMLVMFDGFDEVKEEWRSEVMQWIHKTTQDFHSSFFLLTSRPSAYHNYASLTKFNSVYVKPLNEVQQEKFIKLWYLSLQRHISAQPNHPSVKQEAEQQATNLLSQLRESPELSALSQNPLLLKIIINLHSSYFGEHLPKYRTDLYQEIFRMQLGERPLVRKIDMLLEVKDSQKILQLLALYMLQSNRPQIEVQQLLQQLNTYINDFGEAIAPSQFLQQIEEISELLVKRDLDYEFAHLSFQGYLAAVEIKETQQEHLLMENWDKSWWRETIILYTALVKPNVFSQFIQQLLEVGGQNAGELAYNCWQEYPREVSPEFEAQVNFVRYQKLEDYLKNQQW
ncbi:MAG: NACHT domain-containing protein [Microcoleaceae cyanobacterium]